MTKLGMALLAGFAAFVWLPAHAATTVTQNSNIAAGIAAFGPSATVLDWNAGGAPGSAVGNINITNWIDGVGFDNGANPANDLAINGFENVTWNFAAPVTKIGFAMSTGLGILPTEINNLGASFNLLLSNGDTATLTLIDPGNGYAAWIEITSTSAFNSLQFSEVGGDIYDQYWGNVLSTSAVPELGTWALMLAGFGIVGGAMRRRFTELSSPSISQ
jgi:hypothetical protein